MKGEKKMREYLKGEMGDDAFAVMKGKLTVADLFKMAKGMGYDGDGPEDDDDDPEIEIDVDVKDDDDDLEKGGRILDVLADALDAAHDERQGDLFEHLTKSLRDSKPFAESGYEADTLRKSNADAGNLVKSLISGAESAFKLNAAAIESLGDRIDGQHEMTMLNAEAAVSLRKSFEQVTAELSELRKSLGLPDPQGHVTPAPRFPGEGAPAKPAGAADPAALHAQGMQNLRKSMRECKAKGDKIGAQKLDAVSAQFASLGAVQRHPRGGEILAGLADGSLIEKITAR